MVKPYPLKKILIFLFGLFLFSPKLGAFTFHADVIEILAGDYLHVLNEGYFYNVRLANVVTPVRGQPFYKQAKKFTSNMVYGKNVRIKTYGVNSSGDLIGEVFLGEKNLNRELVREGLAWEYKKFSQDSQLAALQMEAKAAKKGLWSQDNPQAPWKHKGKK